MKNLRKVLAVVMAMIMLMSALPMVSAGAEEQNDSLFVMNELTDVVIDESGTVYTTFTPEEDGWYEFYSVSDYDTYIYIYQDDIWNAYDDDGLFGLDFSLVVELKAETTYAIQIGVNEEIDSNIEFQVGVQKTVGVVSMEVTQLPDNTTVVEDYEYDTLDFTGLIITITFSDGTQTEWSVGDDSMPEDYMVYWDHTGYVNGDFAIEFECGSASCEVLFTIIESPVESIEYYSESDIEYYENTHGYFDEDYQAYIYEYEIPDDAMITIYYNDGTSVEVSLYDDNYCIETIHEQDAQPWMVGAENYITVSYLGATVEVPVYILSCPFVDVVVNSAPSREYIYGDIRTGHLLEKGAYWLYPSDMTGLSFTVEYKDGSKKTFTDADIDTDRSEIDNYEYFVPEYRLTQPGKVQVILNYKGYDIKYDVNVVETPIADIEVVSEPNKTVYEDRYLPVFDGMVLNLKYKDGTSELVTFNNQNTSITRMGSIEYTVTIGDDYANIYSYINYETEEEVYVFYYLGAKLEYRGFTFTDRREVDNVAIGNIVSPDGDGMTLTVTYVDGVVEKLTYQMYCVLHQLDDLYVCYALTDNGIIYYTICKEYDENGGFSGYSVLTLDGVYKVDCNKLGDVDGDGDINIMDATAIQLHIASIEELDDSAISRADVDKNGNLTIMDTTFIQLYIAELIEEF